MVFRVLIIVFVLVVLGVGVYNLSQVEHFDSADILLMLFLTFPLFKMLEDHGKDNKG
jgi:hypothetical protein